MAKKIQFCKVEKKYFVRPCLMRHVIEDFDIDTRLKVLKQNKKSIARIRAKIQCNKNRRNTMDVASKQEATYES